MGIIKVSDDAATFGVHSGIGTGMVARDSLGELVQAVSKFSSEVVAPEIAEVMVIKEALSWIKLKPWEAVILESDSLVAVQAIRSRVPLCSPFGLVVEECRNILQTLNKVFLLGNLLIWLLPFPGLVIDRSNVPVDFMNILLDDLSE